MPGPSVRPGGRGCFEQFMLAILVGIGPQAEDALPEAGVGKVQADESLMAAWVDGLVGYAQTADGGGALRAGPGPVGGVKARLHAFRPPVEGLPAVRRDA